MVPIKRTLCALLVLICVVALLVSCKANQDDPRHSDKLLREDNPIRSLSGLYVVTEERFVDNENTRVFHIVIASESDGSEYVSDVTFRYRDNNYILWADDGTDILWAISGDTGIYILKHDNGFWKEERYSENQDLPVPELLLELNLSYWR